jgi:hypothetical protein
VDPAWIGVIGGAVGGGVALVGGFALSAREARREHRALRREAYSAFLLALDDARDTAREDDQAARNAACRQLERTRIRVKLLAPEVISDAAYDAAQEARNYDRKSSSSAYSHFTLLARTDVTPSVIMGPRVLLAYLVGSSLRRQDARDRRKHQTQADDSV